MSIERSIPAHEKRRLRAHFGVTRIPFAPRTWARHMFESQGQRELLDGLAFWTEVKGIAMVSGPAGVGKSITLRRFRHGLSEERYRVFDFTHLPTTINGFLRSLSRTLKLPVRRYSADLFDATKEYLGSFEQDHGPHPILIIDDGEGLTPPVLDLLRRLTAYDLDTEPRFSLLITGTEALLDALRGPQMAPLRSRIVYTHTLRPFAFEDTRNYMRHRLEHAAADPKLFSDEATKRIFQASRGIPRAINQLSTQALIVAAVYGRDVVDGDFMGKLIADHPLYQLHDVGAAT